MSTARHLFDIAKEGVVLRVQVQPGAGRTAVVGTHGDALKVRVVAPPLSGRANEAVVALLTIELGIDKDSVSLTAGASGRLKRFKIIGLEPDEAERRLEVMLETAARSGRGPKK